MANILGRIANALGFGGRSGTEPDTGAAGGVADTPRDPTSAAATAGGESTAGVDPIGGGGDLSGSFDTGGQSTAGTEPITPSADGRTGGSEGMIGSDSDQSSVRPGGTAAEPWGGGSEGESSTGDLHDTAHGAAIPTPSGDRGATTGARGIEGDTGENDRFVGSG